MSYLLTSEKHPRILVEVVLCHVPKSLAVVMPGRQLFQPADGQLTLIIFTLDSQDLECGGLLIISILMPFDPSRITSLLAAFSSLS